MQKLVEVKRDKMSIISLVGDSSEPELRKEFIKEMRQIEKDKRKPIQIKNIDDLFVKE